MTVTDPTAVICYVTFVLLIRHPFNKEITEQVTGMNIIQTLGHTMMLTNEVEIKLKKYERPSNDDPCVMCINVFPQSQSSLPFKSRQASRQPKCNLI